MSDCKFKKWLTRYVKFRGLDPVLNESTAPSSCKKKQPGVPRDYTDQRKLIAFCDRRSL